MISLVDNTDELLRPMLAGLLKGEVQRHIFCECGSILDIRRAVHWEAVDRNIGGVVCVPCWAKAQDRWMRLAGGDETAFEDLTAEIEFIDGREIDWSLARRLI
jgi:hypothetical protein